MESIWTKTYDRKKISPLESDIDAEAAVIGGGMAGHTDRMASAKSRESALLSLRLIRSAEARQRIPRQRLPLSTALFCHTFIEKKGKRNGREIPAGQSAGCR